YSIPSYLKESGTHITRPLEVDATPRAAPFLNLLRRRTATYDPGKGSIATLTNMVTGGKVPATGATYTNASSTYTYTHDGFGNLQTFQDPTGYKLKYTYDQTTQTYRTQVDDLSFGYSSSATYDFRFGVPLTTTDVNGQLEGFTYDTFGRLCTAAGPSD